MIRPLRIAVIADDLTGAADTGVQFCSAIGPVLLTAGNDKSLANLPAAPAGLAVSTDSRHADSETAATSVRRTAKRLAEWHPDLLYKKIDSCLRGNLGPEIDALLQATGAAASFVAPAFPEQGRTTIGGIHRINRVPVAASHIGRDPLCPVRQSHLPTLLAGQSRLKVEQIDLAWLEGPPDRLVKQIQGLLDRGCRHLVFDAELTKHLDCIATLACRRFNNILPVGSAGLAGSLARVLEKEQTRPPASPRPTIKTWLFVCGSASPVLARQVDRLAAATGWRHLAMKAAFLATATPAAGEAIDLGNEQGQGTNLVLSIESLSDSGAAENPDRVVRGLVALAADRIGAAGPDAVFLSGGDTAEAFRQRIGASGLLLHEELLPGLVRGELVGGPCDGLPVVTKAGAFGRNETLIELVNQFSN